MSKSRLASNIVAVAAFLLAAAPALASEEEPTNWHPVPAIQPWDSQARELMLQGRLDEAAATVEAHLLVAPKDVQARFLKGMIVATLGKNREAIDIFRAILIDEPGATRVRLELARVFFLERDFGNALRQFQFVLAANPPEAVAANIQRYIAAIRQAKSLSYSFSLAVAPDTNLNAGSSAREVTIFGLPFDLSEEAMRRSGVGLAVDGGGEWAPTIANGIRLRIGTNIQRREYVGADFDDMTVAGHAGPRIVTGNWDLSALGTAYRRWYGGDAYNNANGVRLEATYYVDGRLGISGAVSAQRIRYAMESAKDGGLFSLGGGAFYALTPTSGVNLKGGISRQSARDPVNSNWSGFVAAGYFRELPMGFSTYLEPSWSIAEYDAVSPAFGRRRSDRTYSLLISLLNRRLVLGRFTPRISYTFVKQTSSLSLHRFGRNRVEVGLTTVF